MNKYKDRKNAGICLAEQLKKYKNQPNTILLALPRGGVPVAYEIATALNLPLDLYIVRKLGLPTHAELAIGAIASEGVIFLNQELIKSLLVSKEDLQNIIQREETELKRREQIYRGEKPFPDLEGKTVIIVDDGIATGATMQVAITGIRRQKPVKLIIAVPVAPAATCQEMKLLVDEILCPLQPIDFFAVGKWYQDFNQTTDEEVFELLREKP